MNILFTDDLWTVLLIMLIGGIIGGTVNFYFVPPPDGQSPSIGRCIVLGIGASALVPVFLFVTQSKVLDKLFTPQSATLSEAEKLINTLVFISLCLLAGISSSRFITSVSDQVITQLKKDVQETKEGVKENGEKIDKTQQDVQETKATVDNTQQTATENKATLKALKEVQRSRVSTSASRPRAVSRGASPVASDDLQRGLRSGENSSNGYELSATVVAVDSDNDLFRVTIQVLDTNATAVPNDSVTFYLRDTFTPQERIVPIQNQKATLELVSWGAFTVEAETANGSKLELDLSDPALVPDAPQAFRAR